MAWKSLPPAARNVSRPSIAISSSVSRQSTRSPGRSRRPAMAGAGQLAQRDVGVGLEPSARPKRPGRSPGIRRAAAPGARPAGEPSSGIRSDTDRPVQRAVRHAMEAHHQHAAAALALQCSARARPAPRCRPRRRGTVDQAQLGHAAHAGRPRGNSIEQRWQWWRRVLRIQRHHQDARRTLCLQRIEPAGDRGLSVAHRRAYQHRMAALAQRSPQRVACLPRPRRQRRALGVQMRGVLGRRLCRPHRNTTPCSSGHHSDARNLHHPRVAQELGQVPAHRARVGASGVPRLMSSTAGVRAGRVAGSGVGMGRDPARAGALPDH